MLKSLELANNVSIIWDGLRTNRPDYFAGPVPGFEAFSFDVFDSIFKDWVTRLEAVSRTRWIESGEAVVSDGAIAKRLSELSSLISQANNNALSWLYSSTFPDLVAETGQRIAVLTDRRASIAGQLAKELKRQGVEEIGAILDAAEKARDIAQDSQDTGAYRDEASKAAASAKDQAASMDGLVDASQQKKAAIEEAEQTSKVKRDEIEKLHSEATGFRDSAEQKSNALSAKIVELEGTVGAAEQAASEATENLRDVIRDARRQGLAGAFMKRAGKLNIEQYLWFMVFYIGIFFLLYVAVALALDLPDLKYESIIVALLRRVGLAAPVVWLSWYAARQIGRVGRLKEDYEYKAATALAFESYMKEVAESGNEELVKQLLGVTIANFGANPVRLLEHGDKEPVSPMAELMDRLEKDGVFKLMAKFNELRK